MGGERVPPALGEHTARPMHAVLWIAVALPLLCALSARDLWSPDEPRYGQVAREMLEGGDWLVPRLNAQPYAEKPPLAFWGMAALGAARGDVGPVEARLFPALLTALATLALARLVRRWFGDPAMGDTAALLFSTTGLILWDGSRAVLDPVLAATGVLAVHAATEVVVRRSTRAAVALGAALGVGLLAKGPHALLVPVAALVGGCWASGAGRRLLDGRWVLALCVAAALAAAWLVPAVAAGGDAYRARLLGQIGDRVVGADVPHANPVFYLLLLLPVVAMPWTLVALPAATRALRPSRAPGDHRFGLGASAGAVLLSLVVLSIPASKRDVYLIPLLPYVATLAAYAIHTRPDDRRDDPLRARHPTLAPLFEPGGWLASPRPWGPLLAALACGTLLAPFLVPAVLDGSDATGLRRRFAERDVLVALGAVALLLGSGAFVAGRVRTPSASARATALALAAAWIVVATLVLPAFDPWKTHAAAARRADRVAPAVPLVIAGFSDTSVRWWFRDRPLSREPHGAALAGVLRAGAPPVLVLAKARHWDENTRGLWPAGGGPRVLDRYVVGGTAFVLATNVP